MPIKKIIVAVLTTTLAITAFGCGLNGNSGSNGDGGKQEQEKAQKLRWNLGAEPKELDPQINSALDAGNVINNMYSGLMRDQQGEMVPEMAERYEVSDDQLTYTFYLKEAKWSDGKPVRAKDFEYAWKRGLDPNNHYEYAFQLFYIRGGQDYYEGRAGADAVAVKAINNRILQVTLIAPTAYFLQLTAFPTYLPVREDVVKQGADGSWAKNPAICVSNGPFKLESYQPGTGLILKKNSEYVDASKVSLDTIEMFFSSDEQKALSDFEGGNLDVVDFVPVNQIPQLESENEDFYIFPHNGTHFYYFNMTNPLLQDIRIRQALSLAIDRNALVTTVTKAGQIPATGVVPIGVKDTEGKMFREVAGNYGFNVDYADVETAKRLLAEAGYPDGQGFPEIEILVNDSDESKAITSFLAESWKATLNIQCRVSTYPWATLQEKRSAGDFVISRGGWIGDYSDPMTFLDLFLSYSGNNDAHWANPVFDNLIEEAKLLNGSERSKRLYQAEKVLAEQHVIIPLFYLTDPALVSGSVTGWERTTMGSWYFGNAKIKK